MSRIQLFTNAATGSSEPFYANGVPPTYNTNCFVGINGDFDGATVFLQWRDPDGIWSDTDTVNDKATASKLLLPFPNDAVAYRLTITGGVAPVINAWAFNCKLV